MILALDIGLTRTGAAIGSLSSATAQPAGQIACKQGKADWPQLDKLIAKWQPECVLLGTLNNQDRPLTKLGNRIRQHIQSKHKLAVIDVDETLSTVAANEHMADLGISHNKKKDMRDQIAACIILQTWLNQQLEKK